LPSIEEMIVSAEDNFESTMKLQRKTNQNVIFKIPHLHEIEEDPLGELFKSYNNIHEAISGNQEGESANFGIFSIVRLLLWLFIVFL